MQNAIHVIYINCYTWAATDDMWVQWVNTFNTRHSECSHP